MKKLVSLIALILIIILIFSGCQQNEPVNYINQDYNNAHFYTDTVSASEVFRLKDYTKYFDIYDEKDRRKIKDRERINGYEKSIQFLLGEDTMVVALGDIAHSGSYLGSDYKEIGLYNLKNKSYETLLKLEELKTENVYDVRCRYINSDYMQCFIACDGSENTLYLYSFKDKELIEVFKYNKDCDHDGGYITAFKDNIFYFDDIEILSNQETKCTLYSYDLNKKQLNVLSDNGNSPQLYKDTVIWKLDDISAKIET